MLRKAREDNELYKVNPVNNCWEFVGCLTHNGYGQMKRNRKHLRANRYFYEKYVNKIPVNYQIDHLCKNRKCVNPKHLEAISAKENVQRSSVAKLSRNQVKEIRSKYLLRYKQTVLASLFNIGQTEISRIVNNLRW